MRLAQHLIGLPIYTVDGGQALGKVNDISLDDRLEHFTAIHLGTEGLLNRSDSFIRQADVVTLGKDAVLVQNADSVLSEDETPELGEWNKRWVLRGDLQDREVKTPGGTKIGRIGDVILDDDARVAGFSLSQTFVAGPVADHKAISRSAMVEPNGEGDDDVITIELADAERADLRIVYESFFSAPTVSKVEESERMAANA